MKPKSSGLAPDVFIKQIENGTIPTVVCIVGEEPYYRDLVRRTLLDAIFTDTPPDSRDITIFEEKTDMKKLGREKTKNRRERESERKGKGNEPFKAGAVPEPVGRCTGFLYGDPAGGKDGRAAEIHQVFAEGNGVCGLFPCRLPVSSGLAGPAGGTAGRAPGQGRGAAHPGIPGNRGQSGKWKRSPCMQETGRTGPRRMWICCFPRCRKSACLP